MGDIRRFDKFALYILEHYKPPMRIADVAGGKQGLLNHVLSQVGFDVTTIDPVFNSSKVYGMTTKYHKDMATAFDLIVGMHPDEATEEIIYSAKQKPIIIVPCCMHWDNKEFKGSRSVHGTIQRYLLFNKIQYEDTHLGITGANRMYRTYSLDDKL